MALFEAYALAFNAARQRVGEGRRVTSNDPQDASTRALVELLDGERWPAGAATVEIVLGTATSDTDPD